MKIITKILIATFVSMLIVYIVMSFGNASLNIKEWNGFSRFISVNLIFSAIIMAIVNDIDKNT